MEWVLEPGDMLYLPPQYAHDGVAEGECMTYSIGFRAPPTASWQGTSWHGCRKRSRTTRIWAAAMPIRVRRPTASGPTAGPDGACRDRTAECPALVGWHGLGVSGRASLGTQAECRVCGNIRKSH
ncbi:JmjC domain-containing protein [Cupriavidus basilensis]